MKPSEALALNRTGIRHVVKSHRATLMDEAAIQEELQRLLGMSVDGLTPGALPEAFRSQVLAEALPMWARHCAPAFLPDESASERHLPQTCDRYLTKHLHCGYRGQPPLLSFSASQLPSAPRTAARSPMRLKCACTLGKPAMSTPSPSSQPAMVNR